MFKYFLYISMSLTLKSSHLPVLSSGRSGKARISEIDCPATWNLLCDLNFLTLSWPGWQKLAGLRRTQKNAFNSFVGRVLANSLQKMLRFRAYLQTHGNIESGQKFLHLQLDKSFTKRVNCNKSLYRDKITYVGLTFLVWVKFFWETPFAQLVGKSVHNSTVRNLEHKTKSLIGASSMSK